MKTLFPNVVIEENAGVPRDSVMLVLGGRAPDTEWFAQASKGHEIWAIDKGVDTCRASGIIPDILIGDCDSADGESWQWAAARGVPVSRYISDKDLTDFQLALDIMREKNNGNAKKIFLTGAWGGRFDHLWSLVISLLDYSAPNIPFCIADEKEGLVLLKGGDAVRFTFEMKPKALSLISFSDECCGVSISGVRWPLDNVKLEYGFPYAVSNRLDDGLCADVSCASGTLGFYWVWSE